jgi:hypothetical protein
VDDKVIGGGSQKHVTASLAKASVTPHHGNPAALAGVLQGHALGEVVPRSGFAVRAAHGFAAQNCDLFVSSTDTLEGHHLALRAGDSLFRRTAGDRALAGGKTHHDRQSEKGDNKFGFHVRIWMFDI